MPERGTDRADENARGDTDTMTIAEVSKNYEISADTLRYYERIGLLPPVPRTKSGIRDYDEDSADEVHEEGRGTDRGACRICSLV